MTWTATLHGDTEGLDAEAAAKAEGAVRDALESIAGGLVPDGHTGVGATFHGQYTGDVNLLAPGEPTDAGPQTGASGDPVAALGAGEVSAADVAEAAGVEPGTPVPLAPGQALAPEGPATAPPADAGAETAPADAGAGNAAPDAPPAS